MPDRKPKFLANFAWRGALESFWSVVGSIDAC